MKQILTCNDWAFWSSLLFISISSCSSSLFLCLWASAFCSTRTLLSNASVSTRLRFTCLRTWMSWEYYNAKYNMTEDPRPLGCYALSASKQSKIILTAWPPRWRHHNPLEPRQLFTYSHDVTSLTACIFSNTIVRTFYLACSIIVWYVKTFMVK